MTKQRFLIAMTVVGITIAMAACSSVQANDASATSGFREITGYGFPNTGVNRFVDDEAGVACWVYAAYNKGGISCLPIGETRLRD